MRSGSGPAAGRGAFAPPPLPPPWAEGRGGSGGWEVSGSRLGAPRMERAMEQLNRLTRSLRRARTVELPDGRRGVAGRWPGGPSRGRGGLPGPARPGLARPSRPAGVSCAAGRCVAPAPTVRRLGKWKPAPFPLPPPGGFFFICNGDNNSSNGFSGLVLSPVSRRRRTPVSVTGRGVPLPAAAAPVPGRAGGLGCWTFFIRFYLNPSLGASSMAHSWWQVFAFFFFNIAEFCLKTCCKSLSLVTAWYFGL